MRELFVQDPFDRLASKKAAESEEETKEKNKPETAEKAKGKPAESKQVFSREPLAFDWLKRFDLDVSIDIES